MTSACRFLLGMVENIPHRVVLQVPHITKHEFAEQRWVVSTKRGFKTTQEPSFLRLRKVAQLRHAFC